MGFETTIRAEEGLVEFNLTGLVLVDDIIQAMTTYSRNPSFRPEMGRLYCFAPTADLSAMSLEGLREIYATAWVDGGWAPAGKDGSTPRAAGKYRIALVAEIPGHLSIARLYKAIWDKEGQEQDAELRLFSSRAAAESWLLGGADLGEG